MDFEIVPLSQRPEFFDSVAEALWTQWGYQTGQSLEDRKKIVTANMKGEPDHHILVAVTDDDWLGTASFVQHDMTARMDLSPWLASVLTPEQHRHKGVGRVLVSAVEDYARQQGVSPLYLYTPDKQHFYAAMGWEIVGDQEEKGEMMTIMKKDLMGG